MKIIEKKRYKCSLNLKKVKTLFDAKFCADYKSSFKNKKFLKLLEIINKKQKL